jgi:hypothetical protein
MMPLKFFAKLYKNLGMSIYNSKFSITFVCYSPIKLVVAKCWDPTPRGYFTLPRHEQARPVDTQAVQNTYNNPQHQLLVHHQPNHRQSSLNSTTNMSSTISSTSNTMADNERNILILVYFIHYCACFVRFWYRS